MFSGLKNNLPLVMGILNVTPDSFSDGGLYSTPQAAVSRAAQMVNDGADIIDVGGESTRPGSVAVSEDEEASRVVPVIKSIKERFDVIISVDTTKPLVASEAISAGASMLNDVSMLRDKKLAQAAAQNSCTLILMHSRGIPETMQQMTDYTNGVVADVKKELLDTVEIAISQGVSRRNIWLDPGIGFAKTAEQNIDLLAGLSGLVETGFPILVGPSKKSFIGTLTGADIDNREGGTAAAVAASVLAGASAVRVHDVAMIKQIVQISGAIFSAGKGRQIND